MMTAACRKMFSSVAMTSSRAVKKTAARYRRRLQNQQQSARIEETLHQLHPKAFLTPPKALVTKLPAPVFERVPCSGSN